MLGPLDIHTVCIHYAYSLYAKLDDREDDMPEITLPQGTIHYRDAGEGPPVVFLHGLLVDGEVWRKVTPLLQGDARCIVPDLPLGLASHRDERRCRPRARRASRGWSATSWRRWTSRTSRSSATTPAAPSASSSRSTTASGSAGSCSPTATASTSSRPRSSCRWSRRRGCRARSIAAMQPMRAAKARRMPMAYGWLAHEIPDEVTGAWIRPFLDDADIRRDAVAFMRAIDKATMLDAAERLPSLKIPSLVAWGQDDRFFPRELGERLAAALGARLAPIAGARTFVAEDEPEALADLIRELRARGRGAAGGLRRARERRSRGPSRRHSAGNTPGGVDPAHSPNSPIACASAGRPGEERAHVADREHEPRGRGDLQVGGVDRLAAEHAVAQPAVDAVEVAGQRAQVGAHGALVGAVEPALDRVDDRGQRAAPRARAAGSASRPGSSSWPRVHGERPPQQAPGHRLPDLVAPLLGALDRDALLGVGRAAATARARAPPGGG